MNETDTSLVEPKHNLSVMLSRIRNWPELGAILAFLTIFIFFSLFAPRFFGLRNLTGTFTVVSELGIMTIGVAFLMIAGEFDLSVSGVYATTGFLFVTLGNRLNSVLALAIALAVAACIGLLNGTLTLRARVPSFITTLGMMMFLRGMMIVATGGQTVVYEGDEIVATLLSKYIAHGFRPSHIWFIALVVFFSYLLTGTRYGNWVFATGGNKEVARAMGVNVERVKLINFAISSMMAGLSGCIVINRFGVANASFGTGMELETIAACVIGGTFLTGGYGTIIGVFCGAFLMGSIRTGLVMIGAPAYWYQAFVGAMLVIAAAIHIKVRKGVM